MQEREWLQVVIDAQLKRDLKAKAAKEGDNMTRVIERLIELWINDEIQLEKLEAPT